MHGNCTVFGRLTDHKQAPLEEPQAVAAGAEQGVLDSFPGLAIALDSEGSVTACNGPAFRFLGSDGDPLVGSLFPARYLVPNDEPALADALAHGAPQTLSLRLLVGDAATPPMRWWVLPRTAPWVSSESGGIWMFAPEPHQQASTGRQLEALHRDRQFLDRVARLFRMTTPPALADGLEQALGLIGETWQAARVTLVPGAGDDRTEPWEWQYADRRGSTEESVRQLGRILTQLDPQEPQVIERSAALNDAQTELMDLQDARALVVVPLVVSGQRTGWLAIGDERLRPDWVGRPLSGLQHAADHVARALELYRNYTDSSRQRRYMEAIEQAIEIGPWVWDARTDVLRVSPGVCRLLGLSATESNFEMVIAALHSEDREQVAERLRQALWCQESFNLECRRNDGGTLQIVGWPILGGPPEKSGLEGFLRDKTELQRLATAAHVADARLARAVSQAPAVIYRLERLNSRWHHQPVGGDLERLVGSAGIDVDERAWWESRVHPEDVGTVMKRLAGLTSAGSIAQEYRLRDEATGSYRWIYDEANLIEAGADEAVGLMIDITERKRNETAVRDSEARYRALVEDAPILILRYGVDYRIMFANRACADYLGTDQEAMPGSNWLDYLTDESRRRIQDEIAALTPSRPITTYQQQVVVADGQTRMLVSTDRALFDESGQLIEVQSVARDESELQEMRAQLAQAAKMATLGTLVTSAAHELSQPLNVIRTAAQNAMVRITDNPEQAGAKLERIQQQVDRAKGIIDRLRVFGRRSEPEPVEFCLGTAVGDALSLVQQQLSRARIQLDWESSPYGPMVVGYPDQLQQVVINLVANARDAVLERQRHEGAELYSGRIAVSVRNIDEMAVVQVTDNGGGFSDNIRDRLFDLFYTTKPPGQGTGLGLALSRDMLRAMGGDLEASNKDDGACFTIHMPLSVYGR